MCQHKILIITSGEKYRKYNRTLTKAKITCEQCGVTIAEAGGIYINNPETINGILTEHNPDLLLDINKPKIPSNHPVGRPNERITSKQIEATKKILVLDVQKQGKISKAECPKHKKQSLSYRWNNNEGARVHCEICNWTTHFEPAMYQPIPIDPLETYKMQVDRAST